MNDFYKLLARIHGAQYFFALCFFNRTVYKAAHDAQIDVGFEQGHFYRFNGFFDIFFGDDGFSAYAADNAAEGIG